MSRMQSGVVTLYRTRDGLCRSKLKITERFRGSLNVYGRGVSNAYWLCVDQIGVPYVILWLAVVVRDMIVDTGEDE